MLVIIFSVSKNYYLFQEVFNVSVFISSQICSLTININQSHMGNINYEKLVINDMIPGCFLNRILTPGPP